VSIEILVALVVFATATSITPGPNNLMLLSSGVNFGFRRSIPHMLGIGAGFMVLLLAVGAGMGSLLTGIPWLYMAIKIAGGLYLLYLAWRIATSGPIEGEGAAGTKPITFLEAAAFQWVNPKAWVMAVTAMGAYTDPANYWVTSVLVTVVFGIVNLPNVAVWAGLGAALRTWLSDPGRLRLFNVGMAVLLVLSLWPLLR
jgi:threonine/homoserine/homoserine lactone efflux protein